MADGIAYKMKIIRGSGIVFCMEIMIGNRKIYVSLQPITDVLDFDN